MLDFFTEATVTIPLVQIILLMLIGTISLLFGRLKLAMMINYIFTLHWAYVANRDSLMDMGIGNFALFTSVYYIFGLGIVLVAAFAFLFQNNE